MVKKFICSLEELIYPIEYLIPLLDKFEYPVILLTGEMGSGKTTFTSKLVSEFGGANLVQSPTYNLINEYKVNVGSIYHFDLYRIKNSIELEELGFEDIWGKTGISIIEWWKVASAYIPEKSIEVKIGHVSEIKRELIIKS